VFSFHNKDKYFVRHGCSVISILLLQGVVTAVICRFTSTDERVGHQGGDVRNSAELTRLWALELILNPPYYRYRCIMKVNLSFSYGRQYNWPLNVFKTLMPPLYISRVYRHDGCSRCLLIKDYHLIT